MPKGNRTNPQRVPRTFKDTFWNKQRVAKNLTVKEVAEMLGINDARVGMWFTGQLMPQDFWVKDICKLFDVDYNDGQLAFQKAHREWTAEHNMKSKYSGVNKNSKETALSEPCGKINNIAEVILAIYGKLSCEQFLNVYNTIAEGKPGDCDIERILYSKVDFDTYQQIVTIMKS